MYIDAESELEAIWKIIHQWEDHLVDSVEDAIPNEDQEEIDDAKTAMALIREALGLPSEVEKETQNK